MERSGGNCGRKRKYLEDGSHDTTLLPIVIDTADQQLQQRQVYTVQPGKFLPKEWIIERWEAGFYISEVAGSSDGSSLVIMSQGTKYTQQSYKFGDNFPYEWIKRKQKEGFYVTSMATCKNQWAVVMSRNAGFVQQDINFEQFKFGGEFQRFVLNRVHRCQKLAYRLRTLNKSAKERVEKGIQDTKISLQNIQCLAKSQLSGQIKNIDVSMRGTIIEGLQDLPILSSVHFPSIQRINLNITGNFELDSILRCRITIQEPLLLYNVNVTNESNLHKLHIFGKYEVKIRDCTFRGLSIFCIQNAQVSVVKSRFLNTRAHGFYCQDCDSLLMDQTTIKGCKWHGCTVYGCGNVSINNIQVVSCGWTGIHFYVVNGFKLRNAFVQDCRFSGIVVYCNSVGEIQNVHVQGCREYGIKVANESTVRYAQIKCENNKEGELHIREDCEFLRMN